MVSSVWEEVRTPTSLTPPLQSPTILSEKEPITPIKNAALSPTHLSRVSSRTQHSRNSSMHEAYEKARARGVALHRKYWVRVLFEYTSYLLLILFVYFVLIGMPLWKGAVWWLYWVVAHKFVIQGGYAITIGLAALYAFLPLLILFEKDPPRKDEMSEVDLEKNAENAKTTALLIPCYKSANIIGPTLKAALEVFPPENIFVIANGNSETPLDNTEEVCRPYGVNHLWVPIGSKIVAQFAGCYAAKGFENVLLIDDDCALPPNFPIVSDRLKGKVKCVGYTIKSVGPNSSKGTFCQQAQDLEYKMSGLQREFFGRLGSATFPHGAISIWNTDFLKQTFHEHPGFSVSEDWFFGDSCRRLGGRITMCSSVFVETETPCSVFFSGSGSRGGFGEMTIFSQRFKRWNFFFVVGMYYDMKYILSSWKLGWWEFGAKLCVFQEVYETLIYLLAPFMLPISFVVRPSFCGMLLGVTIAMYIINVILFNEIHLRLKKERIDWVVLIFYYTFYKIALTFINVFSCYWSLYKYARYFAKRHPKVIEDQQAIEVVLSLEQETDSDFEEVTLPVSAPGVDSTRLSKRLTLTRVEPDHKQPRWPLTDETTNSSPPNSWDKRMSWL
ncbi:Putative Glycosyl transferase [Penicillium brasilianum]|uniref:Putative Glycosyl transferase n=1 Tax=Penicillium brasilianum TaxID=104259 RepID=A0A0F7TXN2_PENBI|nr:Putative Glycosyl transferase [Penicillium brasilianum]